MGFLQALRSHLPPQDLNESLQGQERTLTTPPGPSYLAFAGGTRRSHHGPHSPTEPGDPIAIWTGFPDVIGDIVSQTGVTDTVRTALSL